MEEMNYNQRLEYFKDMSYFERLEYLISTTTLFLSEGKSLREVIAVLGNLVAEEAYQRGYKEGKENG